MFTRRKVIIMAKLTWLTSLWKTAQADTLKFSNVEQLRAYVVEAVQRHFEIVNNVTLDANDLAKFSADINGEQISGDVTNLFGYIISYQVEDAKLLVDRFVRSLALKREVTADNLVFVIRTQDYVNSISQEFDGAVSERLIDELNVVYMFDSADAMSPIKTDEMMGKTLPEPREIAQVNIRKWLPKIEVDSSIAPILLYYVEDNTMLSSSLIIMDDFWTSVEASVSPDVYLALPRRDQLFIMDAKFQDGLPALRKLIQLTEQDGFNLLSNKLFRRRNGKLELAS
jgi:uncharacterized protein YtpQ (UPF0354 family)